MFAVESLPVPAAVLGWFFVLIAASEIRIEPSIGDVVGLLFLMYPVIWLVSLVAALKVTDPTSRLPYVYAAIPALSLVPLVAFYVISWMVVLRTEVSI